MGVQALQAARSTIFMVDPEDLTLVGRDTKDGPSHPLWDPRAMEKADAEFTASIKKNGIKKPILVRKTEYSVEVLDGRRRVINCRAANIELSVDRLPVHKVPVRVEKGTDLEAFETMVIANAFMRAPSPIESAHLLKRYLVFEGRTEQDASQMFGVTPRTIKNWLLMLRLDPKVQQAVEASRLSSSAAFKFARLSPKEQRVRLKTVLAAAPKDKRLSVTRVAQETGSASATQRAPSKKLVNKLLAHEGAREALGPQFVLGVRWAIGDAKDRDVRGLAPLLRKAKNT